MTMSRWAQSSSHLDRRHGPAFTAAGDGMEGNYSAILHTAPSGGSVQVIIPAFGLTTTFTANISAGFTGSIGDRVLVAFDEQKQPWVLSPSGVISPITPLVASAWIAPTLVNSWANEGSGFESAGYLRDAFGFVNLMGHITGGAPSSVAFTLPVGYRPGAFFNRLVWASGAANGFLQIGPTGTVEVVASGIVSLGIPPFLAEN